MEACHSFWSEPNRCRNEGEIRFPDFEQLTAILSALEWKRHSGPVRMVTDTAGAAFFQEIGLSPFWDGTETVLDGLGETIDPMAFWAAGKLRALRDMPVPYVMLDTDLIVWENVESRLNGDAVAAHAEALTPRTYPDPSCFPLKEGYAFPEHWDFGLPAANTAFLYFRDATLRNAWLDESFDFMRHVRTEGLNPVQTMCFAEQRILPMCAGENGKSLGYLMIIVCGSSSRIRHSISSPISDFRSFVMRGSSLSLRKISVLAFASLLNLSCLDLLLSCQGSSMPYPTTRQSRMMSMSSEKRFMRPYTFDKLVPPLNVNASFHGHLWNK